MDFFFTATGQKCKNPSVDAALVAFVAHSGYDVTLKPRPQDRKTADCVSEGVTLAAGASFVFHT